MLGGNSEFVPRKAEVSSDESLTLLGGNSRGAKWHEKGQL